MKSSLASATVLSVCLLLPAAQLPAQSARAIAQAQTAPQAAAPLTPKARGELARQFVARWGSHVQRVYDVPVGVWAKRMVSSFASADPSNFRNALKRDTYEGAMMQLGGQGHRLSDRRAMERLAGAALMRAGDVGTEALGDAQRDLVFTPLQPCRILDTRATAAGPIAANSTRNFVALSLDYTNQGGSATDCGTGGTSLVGAVAINVSVVTPNTGGYATVFPYNTTQPLASSVNYTAGAIVNNAIVTRVPNPLTNSDFTIYTFGQAHFVADIVGYFSAPQATALECTNTSVSSFTLAANSVNFFNNPNCPAGYRATTPYCWTAASGVINQGSGYNANSPGNATFCSWQNTTASSQTVFGGNVCCRVPGR
jgi:hypothetical protein